MKKAKVKKGAKFVCIPCGKEVVVDNCGISEETLWCCGSPMKKKTHTISKKTKAKAHRKKK